MAFGIGNSANKTKWFDYVVDGKTLKIKIRSPENPIYLSKREEISDIYRATEANKREPYANYISRGEAYLIEEWMDFDLARIDEDGNSTVELNVSFKPEIAAEIFINGGQDGEELQRFVTESSISIKTDFEKKRAEVVGKLSNSTDGKQTKTRQKQSTKESN